MSTTDDAFLATLDALLAYARGELQLTEAEAADLDVSVRTLAGIGRDDD
jgi:hypothetical protein